MPDPVSDPTNTLSGEFRWDTMLVRLLKDDLAPVEPEKETAKIDLHMATAAAAHARTEAADALLLRKLPGGLDAQVNRKLFHERVHYWQLLFCPLVQWGFITFLDRLYFEGSKMGASTRYICSQFTSGEEVPSEFIKRNEDIVRSHFSQAVISEKEIFTLNKISEETAMPYLLLGHYTDGHVLPAYGAMLNFPGSEKPSLFPFTGPYLWEAAAHLSESLFAGEKPERPQGTMGREEQMYLGAWEFWCRVHSDRYESNEDLCLGFLAAVDLALVSEVGLEGGKSDFDFNSEFKIEMASIPYRFGKIAYRAQGFRPLVRSGREAAQAVADWQNAFCNDSGWPTLDVHVKKLAYILTRILVGTTARHMEDTPEGREILVAFVQMAAGGDWALSELEPIWGLLRKAHTSGAPAFGQLAIGAMLNASVYRLNHPGEVALPHLYADRLRQTFPLPIVLMGGQYYQDPPPHNGIGEPESIWEPYPLTSMELVHDIISLVTVRPMRKGLPDCGFIEDNTECFYIRSGLGCPQKKLTDDEFAIRKQVGLDDWCHWLMRALLLRTAPPDVLDRWHSLWRAHQTSGS